MKYGDIVLYPGNDLVSRNIKKVQVVEYPRLDKADSHYLGRSPSVVSCTLAVKNWSDLAALRKMDLLHSEHRLYVDQTGKDSHYYERVILELGDEERLRGGIGWRVPARFVALDPYLRDAATGEVVY